MAEVPADLLRLLDDAPHGMQGWRRFEGACARALRYSFCPPLNEPKQQVRSYSGLDIRDIVFPNREMNNATSWGKLNQELGVRILPIEIKNYCQSEVAKDEVDQLRNYMKPAWGRLGIIVSRREASASAKARISEVFKAENKMILLLTTSDVQEFVRVRERGDDTGASILEHVEYFYMTYA